MRLRLVHHVREEAWQHQQLVGGQFQLSIQSKPKSAHFVMRVSVDRNCGEFFRHKFRPRLVEVWSRLSPG